MPAGSRTWARTDRQLLGQVVVFWVVQGTSSWAKPESVVAEDTPWHSGGSALELLLLLLLLLLDCSPFVGTRASSSSSRAASKAGLGSCGSIAFLRSSVRRCRSGTAAGGLGHLARTPTIHSLYSNAAGPPVLLNTHRPHGMRRGGFTGPPPGNESGTIARQGN